MSDGVVAIVRTTVISLAAIIAVLGAGVIVEHEDLSGLTQIADTLIEGMLDVVQMGIAAAGGYGVAQLKRSRPGDSQDGQ